MRSGEAGVPGIQSDCRGELSFWARVIFYSEFLRNDDAVKCVNPLGRIVVCPAMRGKQRPAFDGLNRRPLTVFVMLVSAEWLDRVAQGYILETK